MGVLLALLVLPLLGGCGRTQPLNFKAGEYRCEFCQMDIQDMRFKAEALSPKGKVHRFDSLECLIAWSQKHPEEVGSRWVTPFYHPEKWVPLGKALILKAERLSSPMGASLSAHESEKELQEALQSFGGRPLSEKDLEDLIREQWRKEISP